MGRAKLPSESEEDMEDMVVEEGRRKEVLKGWRGWRGRRGEERRGGGGVGGGHPFVNPTTNNLPQLSGHLLPFADPPTWLMMKKTQQPPPR